uniref:BHLH domain-containing protein n=1 Tax=Gongylonema pulchrum TaxID=637853 RepID=A0A183DII4_9BILA
LLREHYDVTRELNGEERKRRVLIRFSNKLRSMLPVLSKANRADAAAYLKKLRNQLIQEMGPDETTDHESQRIEFDNETGYDRTGPTDGEVRNGKKTAHIKNAKTDKAVKAYKEIGFVKKLEADKIMGTTQGVELNKELEVDKSKKNCKREVQNINRTI